MTWSPYLCVSGEEPNSLKEKSRGLFWKADWETIPNGGVSRQKGKMEFSPWGKSSTGEFVFLLDALKIPLDGICFSPMLSSLVIYSSNLTFCILNKITHSKLQAKSWWYFFRLKGIYTLSCQLTVNSRGLLNYSHTICLDLFEDISHYIALFGHKYGMSLHLPPYCCD